MVAARYFGTSAAASAFTAAFQVPNLIRSLFADQALSAAFVPVFSELLEHKKRKEALQLAAALFGLNAGVSRIPLRGGTPTDTFTTVRITTAFLAFVLIALVVDRSALRVPRGRALWLISGLGIAGFAGVQWTYNVAINRLPLSIALLLEYLGLVLVVLAADSRASRASMTTSCGMRPIATSSPPAPRTSISPSTRSRCLRFRFRCDSRSIVGAVATATDSPLLGLI